MSHSFDPILEDLLRANDKAQVELQRLVGIAMEVRGLAASLKASGAKEVGAVLDNAGLDVLEATTDIGNTSIDFQKMIHRTVKEARK